MQRGQTQLDIIHRIEELKPRLATAGPVVFVPTMGNLHAGHLQLVRAARAHGRTVVTSIFVNPLQFGPNEDFDTYPRTLDADCAQLQAAGCDVVFAPNVTEMYPTQQQIEILPPPFAQELCGAFRPGFFQGVATVVAKLFNIVQPAVALFGKKDYQQLFVIRALVQQLNYPIEIIAVETMRTADGLALSSRNAYLSAVEQLQAPKLYAVLSTVAQQLATGAHAVSGLEEAARTDLEAAGWSVDYISIRDAVTLLVPSSATTKYVVLGAAWLGKTRLIDNIEVSTGG